MGGRELERMVCERGKVDEGGGSLVCSLIPQVGLTIKFMHKIKSYQ